MKLIENWQNKNLRCYICDTTASVKYEVEVFDSVQSNKAVKICICNKCVSLFMNNKGDKQ